jgi:hypothetical protein
VLISRPALSSTFLARDHALFKNKLQPVKNEFVVLHKPPREAILAVAIPFNPSVADDSDPLHEARTATKFSAALHRSIEAHINGSKHRLMHSALASRTGTPCMGPGDTCGTTQCASLFRFHATRISILRYGLNGPRAPFCLLSSSIIVTGPADPSSHDYMLHVQVGSQLVVSNG